MNTNGHYLAILEVFSNSADPARFLLRTICRQILTAGSVWFLSPICWHRMSTRSGRFL